jgi:hypothetical protein
MASSFGNLGLGELGAESKYVGKSDTFYLPPVVKNDKGEVQDSLLEGARKTASIFLKNELLNPAINYLQNKFAPVPPPGVTPLGVSPIAPVPSQASITVALPTDPNAEHPLLNGVLNTDPFK